MDETDRRIELMNKMLGKSNYVWIEPPFYFCYGNHIEIGKYSYQNMNCTFIDDGNIKIGERVMFGPGVTIATVGHPINPELRMYMYTADVIIEDNCWIGANVTILPGVRIGKNSVIGAGSVVTKDIEENSVAVGNPCKVVRQINEYDQEYYFRDRKIDIENLDLSKFKQLLEDEHE